MARKTLRWAPKWKRLKLGTDILVPGLLGSWVSRIWGEKSAPEMFMNALTHPGNFYYQVKHVFFFFEGWFQHNNCDEPHSNWLGSSKSCQQYFFKNMSIYIYTHNQHSVSLSSSDRAVGKNILDSILCQYELRSLFTHNLTTARYPFPSISLSSLIDVWTDIRIISSGKQ